VIDPSSRPPLQLRPLFGALNRHGVDFVVVGGVAGLIHGSSFPTYDLDIAYARDEGNLRRLAAALQELGVRLRNAPPDLPFQADEATLAAGANFTFDTEFGDFDILGDVAGNRDYEDLRARSWAAEIAGFVVRVVSIDDLIGMKRTASRPKDNIAADELVVIAELRRQEEVGEGES
jgi:hypothetical protein